MLSGWSSIKGGFNSKRFSIGHQEITGIETKDSLLSVYVGLQTQSGTSKLTFGKATQQLDAFYRAMGQHVPQEARGVPPPTHFAVPTEADPSGARGAIEGLFIPDVVEGDPRETLAQVVEG